MKVVGVIIAALALAVPAGASVTKNKLEVSPRVFRTHVEMVAFYNIQRNAGMDLLCEDRPRGDSEPCDSYKDNVALVGVQVRYAGRLLYDETGHGRFGVWEQRIPLSVLQRERGARCAAGLYYWRVLMYDTLSRAGYTESRRGKLRLHCEAGRLVANPNV